MTRSVQELADCIERGPEGSFELWCTPAEWLLVTGRPCGKETTVVLRDDFAKSLERRFGFEVAWKNNCFPPVVLVVGRLQCAGGSRYDPSRKAYDDVRIFTEPIPQGGLNEAVAFTEGRGRIGRLWDRYCSVWRRVS